MRVSIRMMPMNLMNPMDRREFLRLAAAGAGVGLGTAGTLAWGAEAPASPRPDYRGPNVILIRFGGGVRRRETIDPAHTCSPYLCHELTRRGVLFPNMEIDQFHDYQTSHGEGTLYLLTGKYERFRDVAASRPDVPSKFLGARFEARVPTLFEYFRGAFDIPDHQALLINGEDRGDEEFYNFSNHHLFGVQYRSQTLSLRRFKTWMLGEELNQNTDRFTVTERAKKQDELRKLEALDYRATRERGQGAAIHQYWAAWQAHYGHTGLINPRGDRLLTELAIRALKELRPRLTMINYQDCDYVHWGYLDHYTRGVAIMDEEVKRLVTAVEADPFYRDNTVFVVVPDCGRDSNPFMAVPCQHHFGSRSAHEIFALFFGPGIPQGKRVDRTVSQAEVAATVGRLMGFATPHAERSALAEVFA